MISETNYKILTLFSVQAEIVRRGMAVLFFFLFLPIFANAQFNVIETSPAAGVAEVDPSEAIRIQLSDELDPSTVDQGTIRIKGSRSGQIAGTFYFPNRKEILFIPDNEYFSGELITVQVSQDVTSKIGEPLETVMEFSFRVVSSAQLRMSVDETILGNRSAKSIIRSDQDPELTYEVLLGRAEDLAVDRLGIDVVRVSSYTVGLERATAIQTGWYLSPTTYFVIIHEVYETTPRTLFRLEYALKENMEIILTQGNDRRQGIDFLLGKDY